MEIHERVRKKNGTGKLIMIYVETPANSTNSLIDLKTCREIGNHYSDGEKEVVLAVDNTYIGPIWQHPIKHGADLVLYSATKYIGGHSDVIAGAVLGSANLITSVKVMRTFWEIKPAQTQDGC